MMPSSTGCEQSIANFLTTFFFWIFLACGRRRGGRVGIPPRASGSDGKAGGGEAAGEGGDANAVVLGARQQPSRRPLDPIPSIEWWDAPFIATYDDVSGGKFVVRGDKITHLEEHPVMIEPPTEKSEVPTVPLYLTKQERKKLRTKNRVERQRDLQEQIRMGLLPQVRNPRRTSAAVRNCAEWLSRVRVL